jgi:hypothetical protein
MKINIVLLIISLNINLLSTYENNPYLVTISDIIFEAPNSFIIGKKQCILNGIKIPQNVVVQKLALEFIQNFLKDKNVVLIEVIKKIENFEVVDMKFRREKLSELLLEEGLALANEDNLVLKEKQMFAHQNQKGFWNYEFRKKNKISSDFDFNPEFEF